jgi:hypothetical protein
MERNIFDAAAKMEASKKKSAQNKPKELLPKTNVDVDPEVKEMLQKMREMRDDLDSQLNSIYRKGKETKIKDTILIEDTGKLTNKQLEEVQAQKKTLLDKINKALPPETCLKKKQKNKEELTQERKNKMRGARNKWISVR